MSDQPRLTAPQIREFYAEAIRETEHGELNYLAFYEWLRARGMRPKGDCAPADGEAGGFNAVQKVLTGAGSSVAADIK